LDPNFKPQVIAGLIQFVADWAAIGARAQMGFGVVEPTSLSEPSSQMKHRVETRMLYDWLIATSGSKPYPNLPSFQNIFLVQIKPKELSLPFTEQTTFNLKYDLRRLFAGDQNKKLRHFIMGTVSGERMASKVKISRPYGDSVIRVWGWVPEKADVVYTDDWNRNTVVDAIYQHLKTNYSLEVWREMNSTRDVGTPSTSDAKVFLHSLLGPKEDGDGV
jgi:CRISPR-associated protein Cmr1